MQSGTTGSRVGERGAIRNGDGGGGGGAGGGNTGGKGGNGGPETAVVLAVFPEEI